MLNNFEQNIKPTHKGRLVYNHLKTHFTVITKNLNNNFELFKNIIFSNVSIYYNFQRCDFQPVSSLTLSEQRSRFFRLFISLKNKNQFHPLHKIKISKVNMLYGPIGH